ncbi:selenide, water dikinase SelD [Rudaea cellulosilytica]|uniref:selenide, water dikinase SelD n=1 Tax=Rudaea cellulosilytica TaxID=540746 RepID=UPI000371EB17|nr:selenide, water dikinase SelD [Rudaea cellulosilytica]
MSTIDASVPRLTSLSHGGGCGCKIAPGVLSELLHDMPAAGPFADLLVGRDTSDDAAVYRINDAQAIVATTDFFMPIVDDPFDFGRIAATNALSDIYAMGARPLFALAIVGMPINVLPRAVIREILRGGEAICAEAGIPIAGGHSIDSVEPIYGLAATGIVDPREVKRNGGARDGDVLVLGKPLGVGIYSAAFKKGLLDAAGYRELIATTTQLNRPGSELARLDGVHALTDVTGFGLLGHLLEICRASGLRARVDAAKIPRLAQAAKFAEAGIVTGASARNWQSYAGEVELSPAAAPCQSLLSDPQTSGGLLVACSADIAARVVELFVSAGFVGATIIGTMTSGNPRIEVS